jgi:hypothetical protein
MSMDTTDNVKREDRHHQKGVEGGEVPSCYDKLARAKERWMKLGKGVTTHRKSGAGSRKGASKQTARRGVNTQSDDESVQENIIANIQDAMSFTISNLKMANQSTCASSNQILDCWETVLQMRTRLGVVADNLFFELLHARTLVPLPMDPSQHPRSFWSRMSSYPEIQHEIQTLMNGSMDIKSPMEHVYRWHPSIATLLAKWVQEEANMHTYTPRNFEGFSNDNAFSELDCMWIHPKTRKGTFVMFSPYRLKKKDAAAATTIFHRLRDRTEIQVDTILFVQTGQPPITHFNQPFQETIEAFKRYGIAIQRFSHEQLMVKPTQLKHAPLFDAIEEDDLPESHQGTGMQYLQQLPVDDLIVHLYGWKPGQLVRSISYQISTQQTVSFYRVSALTRQQIRNNVVGEKGACSPL